MSKYEIKRWDVVMFDNSITKVPMIYVKPDLTFLEFIKSNNYAVMCEIEGTGTVYDGKKIPGVVDKSCFVPNCRPNFFDKTGYYVITLHASWYGYPEPHKLGLVSFAGINATVKLGGKHKVQFEENIATDIPQYELKNDKKTHKKKTYKCGMSSKQIWNMLIILGLLVAIAMALKNNL